MISMEGRGTIGGYYMNIYFEADLSEFIQGDAFGFTMILILKFLVRLFQLITKEDGFTMYPTIH